MSAVCKLYCWCIKGCEKLYVQIQYFILRTKNKVYAVYVSSPSLWGSSLCRKR